MPELLLAQQTVSILYSQPSRLSLLIIVGLVALGILALRKLDPLKIPAAVAGFGVFLLVAFWFVAFTVRQDVTEQTASVQSSSAIRDAQVHGLHGQGVVVRQQTQPHQQQAHAPFEQVYENFFRSRIPLEEKVVAEVSDADEFFATAAVEPAAATPPESKVETTAESTESQPRPKWVDAPPKRVGNVYREVVSAGPYKTIQECHRKLEESLRKVVDHRVRQVGPHVYHFHRLESLGLSMDFVLSDICQDEWVETASYDFGDMKTVHVLMEFDAAVDARLREASRDYMRQYRVEEVALVACLILGGLAAFYGVLKVDTWTRGYYTKRLFFGASAAIILFIVMCS